MTNRILVLIVLILSLSYILPAFSRGGGATPNSPAAIKPQQDSRNRQGATAIAERPANSRGDPDAQLFVNTKVSDAAYIQSVFDCLQKGNIDDAKYLLRLKQDGSIVAADLFIDSADSKTREYAARVFRRIAKDRKERPFYYHGKLPQDADADAKVEGILAKYR